MLINSSPANVCYSNANYISLWQIVYLLLMCTELDVLWEVLMEKTDEESICSCDLGDVHTVFCCSTHSNCFSNFVIQIVAVIWRTYLQYLSKNICMIMPIADTSTRWSKQQECQKMCFFPIKPVSAQITRPH